MELWIRSQDKRILTKINDIRLNPTYLDEIIANYKTTSLGSNEYEKLGLYKTKERALEVLDEIQNLLDDISDNKIVGCVYQMPSE